MQDEPHLYVELRVFSIFLNEFPSWLHIVAHKNRKHFISSGRTFDGYLLESTRFRIHGGFPQLLRIHFAKTFVSGHIELFVLSTKFPGNFVPGFIIPGVINFTSRRCDAVEWGSGNINMPSFYQWIHIAVKECQKEGPYMRAIHIRIGHNYNLMVPQLLNFKLIFVTDSRAESGNHCLDLFILEDPVDIRFLHIQNFTP